MNPTVRPVEHKRHGVEAAPENTKKQETASETKIANIPLAIKNIGDEINGFSKIITNLKKRVEKLSPIYSQKIADLKSRIHEIHENILKQDSSVAEKRQLEIQLLHHKSTLKKTVSIIQTEAVAIDASGEASSIPADLIGHIRTIHDFREDMGDTPFPLPAIITTKIFEAIIALIKIVTSKTPEVAPDSFIAKDNCILLYHAANLLNCQAVMGLCLTFAQMNMDLTDFNPENTTTPSWSLFTKSVGDQFLKKMLNQFLANPTAHRDLFSLFGSSIKKLDLSRKNIDQLTLDAISKICPNVEELNISKSLNITKISDGFTKLKKLDVGYTRIEQESFNTLPEKCPYLEELNVKHCTSLRESPEGFIHLKQVTIGKFPGPLMRSFSEIYPHVKIIMES